MEKGFAFAVLQSDGDIILHHMWYNLPMKRLIYTLLIAVLLTSCAVTGMSHGFDDLAAIVTEEPATTEEEPMDSYGPTPGAEPYDTPLMRVSVLEPPDGTTPEEVYYLYCDLFAAKDTTFCYPPFEEYMEWLSMETAEEPQDEPPTTVEEITSPVAVEEPEPILDASQKTTMDKLMDGDAPDSILVMFCILFIATLFTLCYIAKQRKEAAWHRFRD